MFPLRNGHRESWNIAPGLLLLLLRHPFVRGRADADAVFDSRELLAAQDLLCNELVKFLVWTMTHDPLDQLWSYSRQLIQRADRRRVDIDPVFDRVGWKLGFAGRHA